MALTQDDVVLAEKLLARMEKNAQFLRKSRWIALVVCLAMTGAGMVHLGKAWSLLRQTHEAYQTGGPSDAAGPASPSTVLAERLFAMYYSTGFTMGFFVLCIGAMGIAAWLSRWQKADRDMLLVRMIRSYLQDQQAK